MTAAPQGERHSVRIQVRCDDVRQFQEHFAPWYAADGIFLPGDIPAPVGTRLRIAIELRDGRRVLSGTARVDAKVEVPAGTRLRIVRVDPGSVPLAPVLAPVSRPHGNAATPPPQRRQARLDEVLFADVQAPEEPAASKPLEVRRRPVKLRLRPTSPSQDPRQRG